MRWFFRALLVFLIVLAAYTVWPFIDLYRLSAAIEAGNISAIERHVSFGALRNSVSRQLLTTYLALTGDEKVGKFTRSVVIGSGTPVTDGIVADTVTAERLWELFEFGEERRVGRPHLAPEGLANLWALYASSDYRGKDFHVMVPPNVPKQDRFRLRLRLTSWTWRLIDIELPHEVRIHLAQKLIKALEKRPG